MSFDKHVNISPEKLENHVTGARMQRRGCVILEDRTLVGVNDRTSIDLSLDIMKRARFVAEKDRDTLRDRSVAGIHMWAAEQLSALEPRHPSILGHCIAAFDRDSGYQRVSAFLDRTGIGAINRATGKIIPIPREPGVSATSVVPRPRFIVFPNWEGANVLDSEPLTIRTSNHPWGYSAAAQAPPITADGLFWLRLELEVKTGSVGIARQLEERLIGERFISERDGCVSLCIPLIEAPGMKIMLRSGSEGGSVVVIHKSEFLLERRAEDQASSRDK